MEQNTDSKQTKKEILISFLARNKNKIIILSIFFLTFIAGIFISGELKKKNDILISEKYIKANLLLNSNQKEEAKKHYKEIITSKNKFYSLLSLNSVIEKNLINDQEEIINFFSELEKNDYSSEFKDLISFKKALYFLKIKNLSESEKILKNLINNNSKLKNIAQEILEK